MCTMERTFGSVEGKRERVWMIKHQSEEEMVAMETKKEVIDISLGEGSQSVVLLCL